MDKANHYVLTVAEYKSISKAARILYISQPSLSKFISNLENNLGVKLFVRTNNGIELTEAGEIFVEYAKQIETLTETMYSEIEKTRSISSHEIKIGMTLNSASFTTSSLIGEVKKRYPQAMVRYDNMLSKDIEQPLLSGLYNFCICPDCTKDSQIKFYIIHKEPYILVAPNRYDLWRYAVNREGMSFYFIDLKQLPTLDFILQENYSSVRKGINKMLKKSKMEIHSNLQVVNSLTALHFAENDMGCCIVPLGQLAYLTNKKSLSFYQVGEIYYSEGVACRQDHHFSDIEKYCISITKKGFLRIEQDILRQLDSLNKLAHI